eukprot:m.1366309 g.1366309  ORF g.1366309 m.1366309 type:complete len:149 (-) comp24951_c0_seq19:1569-2015(-)
MTGVIDKYAVISEHLHYNPGFDADSTSGRTRSPGYLDVASRVQVEDVCTLDRTATVKTNEIVLHTGGDGNSPEGDFNFEPGGHEEAPESAPTKFGRRNSKVEDKPIDLRTGTVGSACPCGWKYICVALLMAVVVAGAVLAFYFIRHGT